MSNPKEQGALIRRDFLPQSPDLKSTKHLLEDLIKNKKRKKKTNKKNLFHCINLIRCNTFRKQHYKRGTAAFGGPGGRGHLGRCRLVVQPLAVQPDAAQKRMGHGGC